MNFKKYMHVERFGTTEVKGIENGRCFVFDKIDGTNSSVFTRDNIIRAGSRNRELTLENDNAGFYAYILQQDNIKAYLEKHPNHRLYGEFLVPHSLRTYRDDAWNQFYIFDVSINDGEDEQLIPYEIYQPMLDEFNLNYIPPICVINNPTPESLIRCLDNVNMLIQDGKGNGEGIVIKNYDFINKYGRQTWAKIVSNEFKEQHKKSWKPNEISLTEMVEEKIANKFCTTSFVEKEFAKIITEKGGWESRYIPMLLNIVYYELIKEESWNIIKEFKNPKIDYKVLQNLVYNRVKQIKSDIFA